MCIKNNFFVISSFQNVQKIYSSPPPLTPGQNQNPLFFEKSVKLSRSPFHAARSGIDLNPNELVLSLIFDRYLHIRLGWRMWTVGRYLKWLLLCSVGVAFGSVMRTLRNTNLCFKIYSNETTDRYNLCGRRWCWIIKSRTNCDICGNWCILGRINNHHICPSWCLSHVRISSYARVVPLIVYGNLWKF